MLRLLGLWLALVLCVAPARAAEGPAPLPATIVHLAELPPPPVLAGKRRANTRDVDYRRVRGLFLAARAVGAVGFGVGALALTLGVLDGSLGGVIIGVVLGGGGLAVAGIAAIPGQIGWHRARAIAAAAQPPGPVAGAGYASLTLYLLSLATMAAELATVSTGGLAAVSVGCLLGSFIAAELQQRTTHRYWLQAQQGHAGARRHRVRARLLPNGLVASF